METAKNVKVAHFAKHLLSSHYEKKAKQQIKD